jgi:hypothetical protein
MTHPIFAGTHVGWTLFGAAPGSRYSPTLRMCAIGGSIFRHAKATAQDVAEAIYAGMAAAFLALEQAGVAHGITLVEFENGDGGFPWL